MQPIMKVFLNSHGDLINQAHDKTSSRGEKNDAVDQIYSHLAKHVTVGFNFMGSGLNTKATGIILTPYYVNII